MLVAGSVIRIRVWVLGPGDKIGRRVSKNTLKKCPLFLSCGFSHEIYNNFLIA
jgi:hypothetical protein